ncbi:protein KRI1 homolog [Centruroides vittatus]|uniref:protein KRI1 homolog n=1 Tax=Centruroides vittatus TaxID=120091 RepID=UPI003510969C
MDALIGDDSSECEQELSINEEYAKKYTKWREKEELQKLKDRYGEDGLRDSSSESSSSSSEEEEELNNAIEKDFLKAISLLKSKDPRIYDKNTYFFSDKEENDNKVKKKKKEKPMYWKDQERQVLLEKDGVFSDDETEKLPAGYLLNSKQYKEERKQLKKSFEISSDCESDDEFLKEKILNSKEKEAEDAEYLEWLKGEKQKVKEDTKDLKFLHNYWNNPDLNPDEVFLKDFLLNKKYMDKDDLKTSLIDDPNMEDEENLSEDEKILDQQETFEHKFNFRFEEPDPEFIKRYPRTLKDSLRRKDDKRKVKRDEIRERKKEEKLKKKEELMRLKALKRKEIEEKLEKLKEITGNTKMAFEDLDFDSDFDPDKHDENMQKIFNDEYYKEEEEIQKPVFPSDEEIDAENWDNWTRENYENQDDEYYEPHCEDPDFIMDADYDPQKDFQRKLIESTKRRKGKRKSKFSEMISDKRPEFDPEIRNFESYLDEYYKLDYEDIIDDMPVRFSYRKVVPNDFGLTVDEILTADDKELNRWCSLKKTCQYRTKEEEIYDVKAFQKKSQNLNAKKKILLHSYLDKDDAQTSVLKNEKTQKLKSLDKSGEGTSNQQKVSDFIDNKTSSNNSYNKKKWKKRNLIDNPPETKQNDTYNIHKNKKKRYKSKNFQVNNNCGFSDNRLKAYGINPKKYKNKFNRKKM